MKKARSWKEMRIEDGSLVMIDVKSETVAVIPEEELNGDELENLNVKLIKTQTKDYWVSFMEKLTAKVYQKPFAEVQGKWIPIAQTDGKIILKKNVEKYLDYKLGEMYVEVYVLKGYEPVLRKTYKPVKAEMMNPEIKEEDKYYNRGVYYSGYEVKYEMKYTYSNGATAIITPENGEKFFMETPKLWIYRDDKGQMVTEASAQTISGVEYCLTETGVYRRPIVGYTEKKRIKERWEYSYDDPISNTIIDKIPILGEKEPCSIDEVPEECDYNYKGDYENKIFSVLRQMYLRYGSVEGALKAIESFEDDKKKFYAEKMPELKAKAEAWVKENF